MGHDRIGGDQSGIALVLTLLTISFLVAVTVQLMITIDRQVTVATAQREQVRLDAMALAGLNLARAALVADLKENKSDSIHDAWATLTPDKLKAVTGEVETGITVTDLSGRLQVNALGDRTREIYRQVWLRLLLSGRFKVADEAEAEALVDALGDWVDQDDEEREKGAEESFYQSKVPPYSCRNGSVTALEELLLVKGMSPELLYGDGHHGALASVITVMGDDGTINLNTAPAPVLEALSPGMNNKLAQLLVDFREDRRNVKMLVNPTWYRQVKGFPVSMEFDADVLAVASRFFEIRVDAVMHQFRRTGTAVLLREDEQRQILLSWKLE